MKKVFLLFSTAMAIVCADVQGQTSRTTTTTTTTITTSGYVTAQPVVPADVVRTQPPGTGYVWVSEDWRWNPSTNNYEWSGGKWVRMEDGKKWQGGAWKKDKDGYKWQEGYWK